MKYCENILETIGNTPLVKLNKIVKGVDATVLAKVETFNPGHSIKDRMAVKMIEDAEAEGLLKPGGTIIEGTSGNTGMGLALAAIVKGYKLICTLPDKQSKEKMDILRAMGAEVIVTPTNVAPDDPRSYYKVAERLNKEIPNSFYPNQYNNLSNRKAHYEQTGPEIWEQTEGKITHLVVGVGTGGTISGTAKYLKEKNPDVKIWGIDTYGSVFKKYHETGVFDESEIYSYLTEGIGEDILPANVDFDLIDHFEKVTDRDGMIFTRELARQEGIFCGNSAGSAVAGLLQMKGQLTKDDVVVVIFHDHGSRYVGKIFNDDWMRDRGFLDKKSATVRDVIARNETMDLLSVDPSTSIGDAVQLFTENSISQLPVVKDNEVVGSLTDSHLFGKLLAQPDLKEKGVESIMLPSFPMVDFQATIEEISPLITKDVPAVLTRDQNERLHIITKQDIIQSIC
mgnify:CR=1 FL=1